METVVIIELMNVKTMCTVCVCVCVCVCRAADNQPDGVFTLRR